MGEPQLSEADSILEDWLSGAQVATMLGVSASRVGQLRREHRLSGLATPLGGYLYHRQAVAALLAARPGTVTR